MKRLNIYMLTVLTLSVALLSPGCAANRNYVVNEDLEGEEQAATVSIQMKETAIGIGYAQGEGVLNFEGEDYPFTMKGIDYGSLSRVNIDTSGSVFRLDDLSEFEGMYFQAKAALTLGSSGKTGMWLVNKKGVTIHLQSEEQKGFDLTLGRGGIKVEFTEE